MATRAREYLLALKDRLEERKVRQLRELQVDLDELGEILRQGGEDVAVQVDTDYRRQRGKD